MSLTLLSLDFLPFAGLLMRFPRNTIDDEPPPSRLNASWQPTYLVDSLSKRWGPEDLLNWSVYNWQHWWPHSAAYRNPIDIEPTDDLLGATMCSWGLTYEQHISRLLENFPAFAERTWSVDRKLSWADYKDVFRKILRKAAWLVQDK